MALNREQLTVINELNENIMLLASAGTGKTETLARRVANIIEAKKASGDEILCITFTNKACKEMKERVEQIAGAEGNKVNVSTFHSFCFDIMKLQAKKRTDIFTDFVVFDEDARAKVGKSIMSNPNKALGKWLLRDVFELPEKTLVTYDMLRIFGVDSVMFTKLDEKKYRIDFCVLGTYEKMYHLDDVEQDEE